MREKYSLLLALASGCLIFWITTLFALLQSPEILSASVLRGGVMPHPLEGHGKCDSCHGLAGVKPYPVRHLGWSNNSCTACHPSPGIAETSAAGPVPDTEAKPAPGDETGVLYPPVTEESKPSARKKASPMPLPAAVRKKASAIPHPIKGHEECSTCHDPGKGSMPAPPDHKGWRNESCGGCHPRD